MMLGFGELHRPCHNKHDEQLKAQKLGDTPKSDGVVVSRLTPSKIQLSLVSLMLSSPIKRIPSHKSDRFIHLRLKSTQRRFVKGYKHIQLLKTMKLVLSVFLTLPLLVHAKPNLFERIRGKGNGLVVGNRNGKGPDSDKLPDQVDISDRIKAKFLQKSKVKKNWSPKYQRISKDAPYFIIGGEQVLMEDLYPVDDIFHPDATVTVGGVEQPPKVNIYTTAAFPNLRVLLEENGKKVKRVVRLEPNGNVIELVEVEDDIFAEIDSYADLEVPEGDFDMVRHTNHVDTELIVSLYRVSNTDKLFCLSL